MGDDIVTRLRAPALPCICVDAVLANCSPCNARLDAADEIERLRDAGDRLAWQIRWIEENHPAAISHDLPLIQWELARRG